MSANGQPPQPAVPIFPWELWLRNSSCFFEPTQDGGMILNVCPVALAQTGQISMMPPMVKVVFGADGWKQFQAQVAQDGGRSPIEIARMLPPDPPPCT